MRSLVLVGVWMPLLGELVVRLLDVGLRSILLDTQDAVRVLGSSCLVCTTSMKLSLQTNLKGTGLEME